MSAHYLLDTHVFVRWVRDPRRLSRPQLRATREAVRRMEPLALSAMSLLEISMLARSPKSAVEVGAREVFEALETSPVVDILPITIRVAKEYAALAGAMRDPGDRLIVATARVHGLCLLTSDQRIIESKLVPVID